MIVIKRESIFHGGRRKIETGLGKEQEFAVKLQNSIRNGRLARFKQLLNDPKDTDYFFQYEYSATLKSIFKKIPETIGELFFEWKYSEAIKFYDVWLDFLVRNKNKLAIKELEFMNFAEGHHMKGEEFDKVRLAYMNLFDKYLEVKKEFGVLDTMKGQAALFKRGGINAEMAELLVARYQAKSA